MRGLDVVSSTVNDCMAIRLSSACTSAAVKLLLTLPLTPQHLSASAGRGVSSSSFSESKGPWLQQSLLTNTGLWRIHLSLGGSSTSATIISSHSNLLLSSQRDLPSGDFVDRPLELVVISASISLVSAPETLAGVALPGVVLPVGVYVS